MPRLTAGRVRIWALACSITMLHGGCGRFGYELASEGLSGAGGGGGDAPIDDTPSFAGLGAGAEGGGASAGVGGGASGGAAGAGPNMAGEGGMAAGGESAQGSLPPLPCATPLVWWTDFSSDPTKLDSNGDAQPDWVIRGGEPFVPAELVNGFWRPTNGKALDTFPAVNFTGRTQARVRMRDTTQTASSLPQRGLGGAVFWFNLDYKPSDYVAVYGSISSLDGNAHELGVFANTSASVDVVAGPQGVAKDAYVVLELDFDPASGAVGVWSTGSAFPQRGPAVKPSPTGTNSLL